MAQIAKQIITAAGLEVAYVAATLAGDSFAGGDRTFLHVKNGAGAIRTVTIPAQVATVQVPGVGPVSVPDIEVAITASEDRLIGPIGSAYRDTSGNVTVNYSSETTVTVAVLELPAV